MADRRLTLAVAVLLVMGAAALSGQATPGGTRPVFSGSWRPADPAKSTVFFNNGIGWVPGDGRVVIEQAANRISITKHVPDEILDPLLAIQGEFDATVLYRIAGALGRAGGAGAAGELRGASWDGDRLILKRWRADSRLITISLALDGDRLKKDSHTVIAGSGQQSTVSEWFTRVK